MTSGLAEHAGSRRAVGGSGPKGEAIAAAALRLFLRDGYERTSVDTIAAEAGVSKRTIYNRYGDKENLFLSVLRETYAAMLTTFRAIADKHLGEVTDVEQDLTAFARETAHTVTTAPDRIALVRLILAEAPYFPALITAEAGPLTMRGLVTGHLARLAAASRARWPVTRPRMVSGPASAVISAGKYGASARISRTSAIRSGAVVTVCAVSRANAVRSCSTSVTSPRCLSAMARKVVSIAA